jgi:hypothetical protein
MQSKLVTFLQQTPCMQLASMVGVTHVDLDFRVSQEWRGAGCVHGQLGQRPTYMVASHASLLRHASLSLWFQSLKVFGAISGPIYSLER